MSIKLGSHRIETYYDERFWSIYSWKRYHNYGIDEYGDVNLGFLRIIKDRTYSHYFFSIGPVCFYKTREEYRQ